MKRSFGNIVYSAWDLFWIILGRVASTGSSKVSLTLQGCSFGKGFSTTGSCSFKARKKKSISLGSRVTLLAGWRSNRVGLSGRVLLQTIGNGRIEVGEGSGGSSVTISARSEVLIGKNVCLGGNVKILDHDYHALNAEERRLPMKEQDSRIRSVPIRIGNDVFVGTNTIILKGVTIGDRSMVAAGAVVFRGDYPPDCIIAGNPAVVVRTKN